MSTLGKPAFLLVVSLCFSTGTASAFPENIRHGYNSCTACHISPAGGGTLTPYGRGTSAAFMATWADEDWGEPLYGLPARTLPDWIHVGGDQRAVDIVATDPTTGELRSTYIPMEESLELAVSPPNNSGLTLDAEVGLYGPDHQVEYRRLFARLDLTPNVGVRLGHFTPSYGTNLPDHTTPIRGRLGLGEGSEAWAAEAYWLAPRGELELTSIFGTDTAVDLDSKRPGAYQTDTATGWAARASVYVADAAQVGLSAMDVSTFEQGRQAGGAFAQLGFLSRGFVLVEADQQRLTSLDAPVPVVQTITFVKTGWEVYQGVMATLQADTVDASPDGRAGVQWMPVPHVEITAEIRRNYAPGFHNATTSGLLLLHHWI